MAKGYSNLGFKILGAWLVLYGLIRLLGLHFDNIGIVMGIMALVAGGLILVSK